MKTKFHDPTRAQIQRRLNQDVNVRSHPRPEPLYHPDDTNHVRHKLRQLYRKAELEQKRAKRREASLKKAGR